MTDLKQIRADLYAKIEKINLALDEVNHVLVPILKILEQHDIPVEYITWDDVINHIRIKSEAKLTEAAYYKIKGFLGFGAQQEIMSSYVSFCFNMPFTFKHRHIHSDLWWLVISNGEKTCKVREIRKVRIVRKKETDVRWEPIGNCTPFEGK